jgi:hypothetical protein
LPCGRVFTSNRYLAHYNGELGGERPHQSIGNSPLSPVIPAPPENATVSDVVCRQRFGGLLNHYYHDA